MVVIISAIAELERNLIIERVKSGLRRARLEGRQIGRRALPVDREALLRDRALGRSLSQIAKMHGISRALVCKHLKAAGGGGHKTMPHPPAQAAETRDPKIVN